MACCSVEGCLMHVKAKGLCSKHYQRFVRCGDPLAPYRNTLSSVLDDFIYRVAANYTGDDCLHWPYGRKRGYAYIMRDYRSLAVHRIVCEIEHGPPPSPKHVAAHSCGKGNEGCVNPKHLRWATKAENEADKIAHGTSARGVGNPHNILTVQEVREIRALKGHVRGTAIAKRYGIKPPTVTMIQQRKTWAWLP